MNDRFILHHAQDFAEAGGVLGAGGLLPVGAEAALGEVFGNTTSGCILLCNPVEERAETDMVISPLLRLAFLFDLIFFVGVRRGELRDDSVYLFL